MAAEVGDSMTAMCYDRGMEMLSAFAYADDGVAPVRDWDASISSRLISSPKVTWWKISRGVLALLSCS